MYIIYIFKFQSFLIIQKALLVPSATKVLSKVTKVQ